MSVRKRHWTSKGIEREAWVVDYFDGQGVRRQKTFARKKEADAFSATSRVEVRDGVHVAERASVTVSRAAELWLASATARRLERTTVDAYRSHVEFHIGPMIGPTLVSKLTVPAVRDFEDKLRAGGRSQAMVKRVIGSLGAIIADSQERGLATHNPVREMRGRRGGVERRQEQRAKGRLKVGTDIPSPGEIRAFLSVLSGRWRPLLVTAVLTGLRSSELRGLRWSEVDFAKRELRVQQRADRFGEIGQPKSIAGERTVPMPKMLANTLREWKLAAPASELGLAFPNGTGNVESHSNIINRGLVPAMIAAGVTVATGKVDEHGEPILAAKYRGLHALRHFYASWCINPVSAGGMGLTPKVVQEQLGHSSIAMTLDRYGHLFPRGAGVAEMDAAESALLG